MLTIENLQKTFPKAKKESSEHLPAVAGISLEVGEGQLYTLLGPSGCGKTTTLRSVAGLEQPDSGRIRVGSQTLYSDKERINVPANERGLGMVFQSYAIWPHMNVFDNVAFPLTVIPRQRRPGRKDIKAKVERVLSVLQLGHLTARQATDLSGGQQQRLALARALVMEPPLLLLDEPLSNLDAKLREEMRVELKRLQRDLGITAVYVTHDQVEALAMSNVIAVMNNGVIEQVGRPRDIYEHPVSRFVAGFVGTANFFDGKVESAEGPQQYRISTPGGALVAQSEVNLELGATASISVRLEHVEVVDAAENQESSLGAWRGIVESRSFLGDCVEHVVRVRDIQVRSRSNPRKSYAPGSEVLIDLPAEWCTIIPADS